MFTHHVPMVLLGVVEPRVQNGRPLAHEGRVSAHVRRQDEVYHTLQQPTNQITGPGHMTSTLHALTFLIFLKSSLLT